MTIFYEKLPTRRPGLDIQYAMPNFFDIAMSEQAQLGWKLTMKGIFSKEWGKIEEEEYERIRKREKLEIWYTGTWWTKHLIKNIIFWALNECQNKMNTYIGRLIKGYWKRRKISTK